MSRYFSRPEGLLTDLLTYHEEMRTAVMKTLQRGKSYQEAAVVGKRITDKYVEKIHNEHNKQIEKALEATSSVKEAEATVHGTGVVNESVPAKSPKVRGTNSGKRVVKPPAPRDAKTSKGNATSKRRGESKGV